MINLTSETPYSDNHLKTKFQAKFSIYDQSFDKLEEYLIKIEGKQHIESKNLSSEHI